MSRLIDLSHPLRDGQLCFPGDPGIRVETHGTLATLGFNIAKVSLSTHQGTHLDVPFHFFDDGKTLDRVSLDRFFGPATLIDLAPGTCLEPRTPITIDMFAAHEAKFQPGAKVIYRTGWDRTYDTPEYFTDFPSLTVAAARWIAGRRIGLLGMDTGTPSSDWQECHQTLLGKGAEMVIVEGLTRLEELPEQFTFIGFPLNIEGRDGSPIRAVGLVE